MITLASAPSCQSSKDLAERAIRIAHFYGFTPIENAPEAPRDVLNPNKKITFDQKALTFVRKDERSLMSAIKQYARKGLGDRRLPTLLFRTLPGDHGSMILELHVLGMPEAIAEGVLISVANAIASDVGIEKQTVHINSIGSPESSARFVRDLGGYLRRFSEDMPLPLKTRLATDPISVALQLSEKKHPMLQRAPVSMDYLNEEERRHFWDVLEHLELAGAYYELNPMVLGSRDCWAHTLFDISHPSPTSDEHIVFARGGRYDSLLSGHIGPGAAAVSVSIMLDAKEPTVLRVPERTSSLYFAHLGKEARRRAVPTLELLRKADIAVNQSLVYEQLGPQMEIAKKMRTPWLLVMGHKEALEGTMIVRDVRQNTQEVVTLPELTGYLRRRHIGSLT